LSLFSSTSNVGEGVCAAAKFPASRKTPSTAASKIELRPEFIHRLAILPPTRTKASSKYYTLLALSEHEGISPIEFRLLSDMGLCSLLL
jgi:hypothetical protein